MNEELVIREIRIDEAAGRGDSDSRMTRFEVITPLKVTVVYRFCYIISYSTIAHIKYKTEVMS